MGEGKLTWEKTKEAITDTARKDIYEDIEGRKFLVEKVSKLSENNNQLLVRIPKKVQEALELKKGDELRFKVRIEGEEKQLVVEVVKSAPA